MLPNRMTGSWITLPTDALRIYFNLCIIKYFLNIISHNNDMKAKVDALHSAYPSIDITAKRVMGQMTDISCEDVRAAFEDEHPRNMVDACDAYALSVFPFGRDDERAKDYESEIWETGDDGWLRVQGSGFRVHGSRFMVASIRRCTARI